MIKVLSIAIFLAFSLQSQAEAPQVLTAVSPANRVALLELYTSEGCSSCPPADKFMSRLKLADISDRQLIPLSFHVTYWDYIGWKDRFGKSRYDDRQRLQAKLNESHTVYTPQFIMNGKDFRLHGSFDNAIARINTIAAEYRLTMQASPGDGVIDIVLNTAALEDNNDPVHAYIAFYEHGLHSQVTDGENEGELLRHDYVVRELKGPYVIQQYPAEIKASFKQAGYKPGNSGIVAFIQKATGPDILQAVRLELGQ
jgi:hypothetical protein